MRVLVPPAIVVLGACTGGSELVANDGGIVDDAGDGGTDVAVAPSPNTTILTSSPLPFATPSSATLVAVRQAGEAQWKVLDAKSAGTYVFAAKELWSAVVVCADESSSHVALFERTNATKTLEVTLDDFCLPVSVNPARKLSGTLSNLPATSGWLDFAYARSVRGSATPVGTSIAYELENVQDGTWDLVFGVRDDASGPLTRIAIRRSEVINADKQIDLDLAVAFPAGSKALDVENIIVGDATTFTVAYAMNADVGLDLGPQIIPDQTNVSTTYSTIPTSLATATDRYRGHLVAQADGNRVSREVLFSIHDPIDVKTSLPSPLGRAPEISPIDSESHLGLQTKVDKIANAARYEIVASRRMNAKSVRTWSVSLSRDSAIGDPIDYAMPNLTAVAGWSTTWDLPRGTLVVTTSAWETPTKLGDGTIERVSRHTVDVTY